MKYVELSRGHGYKILKDIYISDMKIMLVEGYISDNIFYTVICKPQY